MKLRVTYWGLFFYAAFINLLAVFLSFQIFDRHSHVTMTVGKVPFVVLAVSLFLLFFNWLSPTPRLFELDEKAKTLTYAFLFDTQRVVVHYSRIETEWITRSGGKHGPVKVWKCYIDGRQTFSLSEDSYGWTDDQLNVLYEALPKRHP
jgi:hypothetical protein